MATGLIFITIVLPFSESDMNGIIQYVALCDKLLSFIIMLLRVFYVVSNIRSSFIAEYCMGILQFVYHLRGFAEHLDLVCGSKSVTCFGILLDIISSDNALPHLSLSSPSGT